MNPALIAAMVFLQNSTRRNKKVKETKTQVDQQEIDKINNMGLFEAINYLKKKKK